MMSKMKIMSIITLVLLLLSTVAITSASSIKVSPVSIKGSDTITVTNNDQTPMTYNVSLSQIMLKGGVTTIIDDVKGDITMSPTVFTLAPGASQDITVNVGDTKNMQYGVRITGMPEGSGIKVGVSAIVRVVGGEIVNVMDSLQINAWVFPVTISGIPVNVDYKVSNPGNIPVKAFDNVTLYPGDSTKIQKVYPTDIMDYGFKQFPNGGSVFIIPSPLIVLLLIIGGIVVLRRKVEINVK